MPTINKTFLLKFLLVLALLAGALAGVHAVQAGRIPAALLAQADRAETAEKPNDAVKFLRQYLEFEPDDADVRERLAKLLRERAGADAGVDLLLQYERILRIDAKRHEARREALKLALKLGRFTDAAAHAGVLRQEFPADAGVCLQLAVARAGLRQTAETVAAFEDAIRLSPADPTAYQRLAWFQWKEQNRPDKAKSALDRFVAVNPENAEGYLARAKFLNSTTPANATPDPVLPDLAAALARKPNDADAALLQAERLQAAKDLPAAAATLAAAIAANPKDARLPRALAWLEANRGNPAGAVAALEAGLARVPNGFDLLVPLADLLLQNGDAAKAEDVLKTLDRRTAPGSKLQAKYLRGRLAMHRDTFDDAIGHLSALRSTAVGLAGLETQANLLLAECYRRTADPAKRAECYKLVLAKDPAQTAARLALGQLLLDLGRPNEAVKELRDAAVGPTATPAGAAAYLRLRAVMIARESNSAAAWAELDREFKALTAETPNAADLFAETLTVRGNGPAAAKVLVDELRRRPGDTTLTVSAAEALAVAFGVQAGLQLLDDAGGDGPQQRLMRAELYARDPSRLRPLEAVEHGVDVWPDGDAVQLYAGLVAVHDRRGDDAAVVKLLRKIAARRPADAGAWQNLHRRAVRAKDAATAAVALEKLTAVAGANAPAVVLAKNESAAAIRAAFGANPTRADACLALAATAPADEALLLKKRAVALEPHRFEARRELLLALPPAEAAKQLQLLAADPAWFGEPLARLAMAANALPAVQTVLLRHADGRRLLGVTNAAPSPMNPDEWIAAACASGAAQLPDAAPPAAKAVFALMPEGKGSRPTFSDGDRAAACDAAVAVHLARRDQAAAIAVLDEFLKTGPANAMKANRTQAMLLVVRGDAADRRRALALAKELEPADAKAEQLRPVAALLSSLVRYLDGDDRRAGLAAATAAWERVCAVSMDTADRFALAQTYRAAGDRAKFREALNALLQVDAGNVNFLLAGLDELSEARDPAAAAFAARLIETHAADARAVALVGKFHATNKRFADAAAAVAAFEKAGGKADAAADLFADIARHGGDPAQMLAAAAKCEAALAGRPDLPERVAALYAAAGKPADAVAKVEALTRLSGPRPKAVAGLAALRGTGASDAQFDTVRGWVRAARADDPDSVVLRLAEAEWFALKNDYAAAEAAYEGALKLDPRNVVALNNLAWILAPKPSAAGRAEDLLRRAVCETGVTAEVLDTRARVRIAAKQFATAEDDLAEALKQNPTALRLFHVSLAKLSQSPPRREEAGKAFAEAKRRGLTQDAVHPDDVPAFRELNGGS